MNRSSTLTMGGYLLNVMANQAIVVEGHAAGQNGEFYLAVFGDFIVATDSIGLSVPTGGLLPQKVRIMTMHGAKGLSANVVFIPGLEEEILPGKRRNPYPGLILEAARMLYVSITRARAACFLSYADTRVVYGAFAHRSASRFATDLNGPFDQRSAGISGFEADQVLSCCNNL